MTATEDDRTVDPPYELAEMSWQAVETALDRTRTLLVPVGSTEQHGHHLPLGVDVQMPEGVCRRVAERVECLLAPPIWYGVSPHHTFKPGTFTVGSETFQRYLYDVCASAADWGVERLVLVNGHYLAQDPELEIVVRRLRTELGVAAFHVPLNEVVADAAAEHRTSEVSFHASEFETSLMLAQRPDLVRMDRARAVEPPATSLPLTDYDAYGDNRVGWALSAAEMDDLTPTGNVGDPTVATAELGEVLLAEAVDGICELVTALEE